MPYDPNNDLIFIINSRIDNQRRPWRNSHETYTDHDTGAVSTIVPVVMFLMGIGVALYAMASGGF